MNGGAIGGQGGTAPSFGGPQSASPANPSGTFPGPGSRDPTTGLFTPGAGAQPSTTTDNQITSGLRNVFGSSAASTPAVGTLTGILTDPQFRLVIRAIEQRGG